MWKKEFFAWVLLALWFCPSYLEIRAQSPEPTEEPTSAAAEAEDETSPPEENGESEIEAGEVPRQPNILHGAWRMLRESQRHLTGGEEESGPSLIGLVMMFLVVYAIVVFLVLTIWRRGHKPVFTKQRTEAVRGAGRWLCTIAYSVRRKVDARVELRLTRTEPDDLPAELAFLVDDVVRGRIGPGGEAQVDFPGLRPKSFWQRDQADVVQLGFELIQPREHPIVIHVEGRVEYTLGGASGTGGEFREVLEYEPAAVFPTSTSTATAAVDSPPSLMSSPASADPVLQPFEAPSLGSDPSALVAERAAEQANLAAERALASLDDFRQGQANLETRLNDLASRVEATGGEDSEALRKEIRAVEKRLGSDLRENIQAIMGVVDDLRGEVTSLRALVNDLAQNR